MDPFSGNNVYVDVDLTNFAVKWGSNKFISDLICPIVPVDDKTGTYPVFGMENYVAVDDHQGDKDTAKEIERTFERRPYMTERHALTEFLPDSTVKSSSAAIREAALNEMATVATLKEMVLLNKEVATKTMFATSGSYASGLTEDMDSVGDRNFDDSSGPGALTILQTFKDTVAQASGVEPNQMVVSSDAWAHLQSDSSFFGGGSIDVAHSMARIASILGLDEVIVASSRYSAAKIKKDTLPTLTRLWPSNSVWLLYTPKIMSKELPATAKCFSYRGTEEYNIQGELVRKIYDARKGDGGYWYEYKNFYVPKLTAMNKSGKIITGAYLRNVYIAL